jgi:hypothetical protein
MADIWNETVMYFGYEVCLPDNISSKEFCEHITTLYSLNEHLPHSIKVCGILNRFCTNDDSYYSQYDNLASVVLGVSINLNDYTELDDLQSAKEDCCIHMSSLLTRREYPEVNGILDKYEIMNRAKFYSGIEWRGSEYYESNSESEVESDNDGCSRWEDYENDDSDSNSDEYDEVSDEYDEVSDEEDEEDEEDEKDEEDKKENEEELGA